MADAAATSGLPGGEGVNPNNAVQGEGKFVSRANSTPTFGDLDDAEVEQAPKRRATPPDKKGAVKDAPEPKKTEKVEAPAKDEKPAAKPAPKAKEATNEGDSDGEASPEQKPKPKVHRFKNGDQAGDLSGEVVFTVPSDGKKEDVPLQELINNWNGKKKWSDELSKIGNERVTFTKEREDFGKERDDLNSFAADLVKKSAENPDSAIDYLAEMTKQDPVELKEKMLRQHIMEILPLARMSEGQIEQYIREKKLDWRDATHQRRDQQSKEQESSREAAGQRQVVAERFGLDDQRYAHIEKHVHAYLKSKDPQAKAPSPQQVAVASRRIMAAEAVEKVAPHLAKRGDFGTIMDSVLHQLMTSPDITQDRLEALLKEVWGEADDEETQRPLRGVASRAAKNALIDDSETPSPERGRSSAGKKAAMFDDL